MLRRSVMLYGSETWCRENEMAILRRTERAMVSEVRSEAG